MHPETATDAVGMTTEEKKTGNGGEVGTVTINDPGTATMTDDPRPRPIALHPYRPVAVSPSRFTWTHILII